MAISGNQIRAARALIGMEQKDLADKAGVAIGTIRNMEGAGLKPVGGRTDTLNAVVDALKFAGVLFVPENGEGAGVRLRKARPAYSESEQIANAGDARSKAADAADTMMSEMGGSAGEKAGRRGELTDEPAMVAKAKGKKRP